MATDSNPSSPSELLSADSSGLIRADPFTAIATSSASVPAVDGAERENSGNASIGQKPAWKRPSDGGATAEVGPVMDAVSWPALSESTRVLAKSSSESLKSVFDGLSVSDSQGTGTESSSSQKQGSSNVDPNLNPNHTMPAHQGSMKHNGASSSSSNVELSQHPVPAGPFFYGPPNNSSPRDHTQGSGFGSQSQSGNNHPLVYIPPNNSSPRNHTQRSGFGSHFHGGNDHPQQRNSVRNRNGGSHTRGVGSHHQNHGGRRDQDWNNHRYFNGQGPQMQPQRFLQSQPQRFIQSQPQRFMQSQPQRFIRPPPPPPLPPLPPLPLLPPHTAQYIAPLPFGNPMGFQIPPPSLSSEMAYYPQWDSVTDLSFVEPVPPPPEELEVLHAAILKQIDFYFSVENLIRDEFLRAKMDDEGWVPVTLIAGFNKVRSLTGNISGNIQLILDALQTSAVVEVQANKLRRRNDWRSWILPPTHRNIG